MKTDLYTKIVLTVIASSLTIIALNQIDILPKAYANNSYNKPNNGKNYGIIPLNPDGSIDVNLKSATVSTP
ncbi:MAG: hypothetical protein ACK41Z_04305 [Sediminibacterium sp.]